MDVTTRDLVSLSASECRRLLRNHPISVGRVALTVLDGRPLIVPVNYRLDGDSVVVRTGEESLLARRAIGRAIAFEVDDVDPAWQEGWSVLIQGTALKVTDEAELQRLRRLPLKPWAPGEFPVYLRIVPTIITGRRIQ